MRPRIEALAVAAVLAACQPGQDQQPRKPQPRRGPVAAAVEVPPVAYRLAEVDRLRVDLPWSGSAELRAPRVDVMTPRGRLYAQLPPEIHAGGEAGGGTATVVLEVRGTPIDGYRMVGTWRFTLVDGGGPPLATAAIDLQ
jgi:hypothetical protein